MAKTKNTFQRKYFWITRWMSRLYDKKTGRLTLSEIHEYANNVSSFIEKDAKILVVGSDSLLEDLSHNGLDVSVAEISESSTLPLPNDYFDSVICFTCFKKFDNPLKVMTEMYRILKKDGIVLIIDMNQYATNEDIEKKIKKLYMKRIVRWFAKISFKIFLKSSVYTKEDFFTLIEQTSFKGSKFISRGVGMEVWLYKGKLIS